MERAREMIYDAVNEIDNEYVRDAVGTKFFVKELSELQEREDEMQILKRKFMEIIRSRAPEEELVREMNQRFDQIIVRIQEQRKKCMQKYEEEFVVTSDSD